jgi:para-aminobenzoate synthetase/4-amino-4-deoxychorismate lyase
MNRPRVLIDFTGAAADGGDLRYAFGEPRHVLQATRLQEVRGVLDAAEAQARAGRWCVGLLRYEAAPAFEPKAAVHPSAAHDLPLAWFAVFDEALPWPQGDAAHDRAGYAPLQWHPSLDSATFSERVTRIHQAIREGEVYQVNLTAPLHSRFDGEPLALFHALRRAQPRAYAAFIDLGHQQVLSVSPELFFDWREGRLLARPMKGTAPRGATPQEDHAQAQALRNSDKERAENLMIVDLLRNDLARLSAPFGVRVDSLFDLRPWPTVWQMTSDIVARPRAGLSLSDVFAALFPCGSVTGAPKQRTMHWIRQLEDGPRGVYCGALGVLQPGGAATFNVPIRTVVLQGGQARCGIGSGITLDAGAEAEAHEWRHKRGFLERAAQPFELLQTLRLHAGVFPHAPLHLERLQAAARHFGFVSDGGAAQAALAGIAEAHATGTWRVRLLCDAAGRLRAEAFALPPTAQPVRVQLAPRPVEAPPDFLRHKTTRRDHYEALAPQDPALFDTLLWNAEGELTEFTRGSLVAELADGRRVTPPLRCGLLDGVGRALALAGAGPQGLPPGAPVQEAVLPRETLPRLRRLWFVNALRGALEVTPIG